MLNNYYHYYSCPRLLVSLLSLLLQPQSQASIVTYSYWIFIAITILSTISQLPLLSLYYYYYYTYYLLYCSLLATIYHRQKRKTLLYIFERHELFLQFFILYSPLTFYSVMRCLLPLPSTHSATGNFLMGAETTDIHLQKHLSNGGIHMYMLIGSGKIAVVAPSCTSV